MSDFNPGDLKVGDPAIYSIRSGGWHQLVACKRSTVARLTDTQVVLADDTRFRRDNGRMVGQRQNQLEGPGSSIVEAWRIDREADRIHEALHELGRVKVKDSTDLAGLLDLLQGVIDAARERANGGAQ